MAEAADASEVPAVGSSVKLNPFVCGSLAVGLVKRVELVLDCIPYQSHGAQRRVYRIEVTPDEI